MRGTLCCGFHHTCPSLLHTACADTAPASPKRTNPDTATSCALLMHPSHQHGRVLQESRTWYLTMPHFQDYPTEMTQNYCKHRRGGAAAPCMLQPCWASNFLGPATFSGQHRMLRDDCEGQGEHLSHFPFFRL